MIAACVSFVRDQSCRLRENTGLDLTYLVDNRFRGNVERTVRGNHLKLVLLGRLYKIAVQILL